MISDGAGVDVAGVCPAQALMMSAINVKALISRSDVCCMIDPFHKSHDKVETPYHELTLPQIT